MEAAVVDTDRELELADAAMAAFDVDGAVAHLSAAIRGLTAAGDECRAAMACARLGSVFANAMGNLTAARAWYLRAERLVQDRPPCLEQGWVAVAAIGCDVDDPADLLARAELALDRARRFGDVNLETKALADGGLALVQAGRLADGMGMLDEAMALACGAADDPGALGPSVCSFFTACYYAADFARAGTWTPTLRRLGIIGDALGAPAFLNDHCDLVQAALLVELGRWSEAEGLLTRAMARFEATFGMPAWHSQIGLADLRIRQGRLVDAETLLLGREAHLQALLPATRLHAARGDVALARAAARRALRSIGDDRVRAVELLSLLIDVELAAGDTSAAVEASAELDRRIADLDVPALQARAVVARSRVAAATGDVAGAADLLESGLDAIAGIDLPWLRVTLLLQQARLHEQSGDPAAAAGEARAAAAALSALDVVVPPDDVALLARLTGDAPAPAGAPPVPVATLSRDGRYWAVADGTTTTRLPDSKGMRYLAELVAHPGAERHALDLVDREEGVSEAGLDRRRLGDAGELLDGDARTAYRRRIEALRAEVDDELAIGNDIAAEKLQGELDQLVGQLAQAFGLGGRARKTSSAAEKARLNVTRALRAATAKVAEALPGAGPALDRRVRTGLYCAYEPDPGDRVRWIVHS